MISATALSFGASFEDDEALLGPADSAASPGGFREARGFGVRNPTMLCFAGAGDLSAPPLPPSAPPETADGRADGCFCGLRRHTTDARWSGGGRWHASEGNRRQHNAPPLDQPGPGRAGLGLV